MLNYNIPDSFNELFANGENMYQILDNNISEMDNIQSLDYFIELLEIPHDNIEYNYDTEIVLSHRDYNFMLSVSSYGLGDFYSHGYDVKLYEETQIY